MASALGVSDEFCNLICLTSALNKCNGSWWQPLQLEKGGQDLSLCDDFGDLTSLGCSCTHLDGSVKRNFYLNRLTVIMCGSYLVKIQSAACFLFIFIINKIDCCKTKYNIYLQSEEIVTGPLSPPAHLRSRLKEEENITKVTYLTAGCMYVHHHKRNCCV